MDQQGTYKEARAFGLAELKDEELMALAKKGQLKAFETLVQRYEDRLFAYLLRMTGSAGDAEDLFQETFVRVYTHVGRFRADAVFRPWVYRIATNACKDLLRWKRRRREVPFGEPRPGANYGTLEQVETCNPDPRTEAERAELNERLATAVNGLPVRQRAVFVMARYEGLRYEEISRALRIPVGTVKSRMNKAVKRLMDELEDVIR